MRALIQRVTYAKVTANGKVTAEIGKGFVILLGVGTGDNSSRAETLAEKTANLRVFEDDAGKMNLSLLEVGGEAIVVSQFTLYADTSRGRRPSFVPAAAPAIASPLVDLFAQLLRQKGIPTGQGVFGAEMKVEIHNDGPVTILLEK